MSKSIFDIIGPIMVGPSSSHTAGAVKLGKLARKFFSGELTEVEFILYGSFAKTYLGHGTALALLGGVLGYETDSEEIARAKEIATSMGVEYKFTTTDKESLHPNFVDIIMINNIGETTTLSGASVGGGAIKVTAINGIKTDISGQLNAIVTQHIDRTGILSELTAMLTMMGVNIATLNMYRKEKGKESYMVLEIDNPIDISLISRIKKEIDGIEKAFIINI